MAQAKATSGPPLVSSGGRSEVPLAPAQELIWVARSLAPGAGDLVIPLKFELRGALDLDRLLKAFESLAQRHETLRTSFSTGREGPVQRVNSAASLSIETVELRARSPEEAHRIVEERAGALVAQGRDAERGPLTQVEVVRFGPTQHAVTVLMDHLIADGSSADLVLSDLQALYSAPAGRPADLPPFAVRYADYAHSMRSWLATAQAQAELASAIDGLEGTSALLEQAPAQSSVRRGVSLQCEIARPPLDGFSRSQSATTATTFQALLGALLYRYLGANDFCLGVLVSGRKHVELQSLVGCFQNTVPVRLQIDGRLDMAGLVRALHPAAEAARTRDHLPFVNLASSPRLARAGGSRALRSVILNIMPGLREPSRFGDLEYRRLVGRLKAEPTAIFLGVFSSPKSYLVELQVPTSLVDPAEFQHFSADLQVLASHALSGDPTPLDRIALRGGGARQRNPRVATPAGPVRKPYLAPRTPTEEALCGIWAEVLGLERVGVNEDFFALGGHSLLGAQVVARLRSALGVEVPLRALFEGPTVEHLAQAVEEGLREAAGVALPPLVKQPREGALPLSFAQERVWFLEQLSPGQATFNIPYSLKLKGKLELGALQQSLDAVVARHEALRTRFETVDGSPVQVVEPRLSVKVEVVEGAGLSREAQEAEARRVASAPFDLEKGPLVRVAVVRQAADEHLLVFVLHHIISDGWSGGIFWRELSEGYEAALAGKTPEWPPLAVQYGDYGLWQRRWLAGELLQAQLGYWKERLGGVEPLELPTDRPRPPVPSNRGDEVEFAVPRGVSEKLRALSRKEGTTLFTTLLAAFKVLLHRYSGQEDICVGVPSAGRSVGETEPLIGFFVNTLALRSAVTGKQSFVELLREVRETALEAYAHQDVPFDRVVEAVNPVRDTSRSPLFQVMFQLQERKAKTRPLAGMEVEALGVSSGAEAFDMSFYLSVTGEELGGVVSFATELYDASTVRRMLGHYQELLESIAAGPEQKVAGLSMLPAAEKRLVVQEWNATAREYAKEADVPGLFEQQVERTPAAVAVEYEGERLTYRQLDERANQLAHRLQGLGVRPDQLVGVCVERSVEMVVALLGVQKAGAGYVPLDPYLPPDRLAYMLADSKAKVVVTREGLGEKLASSEARLCLVGAEAGAPTSRPERKASPDRLMYVIYTSGSTGKPKGVGLTQRNVVSFLAAMDERLGTAPGVWLAVTTISFDIAGLELYWTLTKGFRVVVHPELGAAGAKRGSAGELLSGRLLAQGATHLQATPSLYRALLLEPEAGKAVGRLKKLLVGGEALPVDLAEELGRAGPGEILNMYGPTETTIWSTTSRVETGRPITIGRPIANTKLYVLDERLEPVGVGVPGELYIGGPGVARGYWERPELTAERFLPDVQGPAGARMYRTGDRVRWLPSGEVEYLGRTDFQVKLRGFRIELGEIEAALLGQPGVHQAVAVVREDAPGDRKLVGYLVPKEGAVVADAALKEALKKALPDYMVPQAFVALEKLPLTPSGKVDRKALPAPSWESKAEFVAPQTPIEEVLCGTWAEILKLVRVGVDDDFFALGGHSLAATRLVARVWSAFAVELPLRAVFELKTPRAISSEIERLVMADIDRMSEQEAGSQLGQLKEQKAQS